MITAPVSAHLIARTMIHLTGDGGSKAPREGPEMDMKDGNKPQLQKNMNNFDA